jgi:uncharacterized protein YdaU (DUF1376 family)
MKRKKIPWMKFNPDEFIEDENVMLMCDEAIGLYMRILCYSWNKGSIPKEHDKIRAIFKLSKHKFTKLWKELEPCFFEKDLRLFQKRLLQEIQWTENYFQQKSDSGSKGADVRWQDHNKAKAQPMQDSDNSELRTESLESSVDSVNTPPVTEPINKASKKTSYSNKTCWLISQAINDHKEVFEGGSVTNSPKMKMLFLALLSVPEIDKENERLLAYVIQAKEAEKPKTTGERLSYAISLLKGAKYAPADSCLQTAKDLLNKWRSESDISENVLKVIPNLKV